MFLWTVLPEIHGLPDWRPRRRKFLLLATVCLMTAGSPVQAQVPLSAYADANGFIDIQQLMCAQLAGTFQEDPDMITTWYSGCTKALRRSTTFSCQGQNFLNTKRFCTATQIPT